MKKYIGTGRQRVVPLERINAMRKIAVIPMEPPPLDIDRYDLAPWLPIDMTAELQYGVKDSAKFAETLENILSTEGTWTPTILLAEDTAAQINSSGPHEATVVQSVYKFPGLTNRERTWHFRNWWVPIGKWYKEKISSFDYLELKGQDVDGILEIALGGYFITNDDDLLVEILYKIIDPSTKQLLGRGHRDSLSTVKLKRPFDNNAEEFKLQFAFVSRDVIGKCLQQIGFVRK